MVKIKGIELTGFRGVKKTLKVTLDSSKSLLLYGDNGTGKSSISDAFEWFHKDKVEHLSGEEIGRKGIDALRNIFLENGKDAAVELKFSDSRYDSKKKLYYKKSKLTSEHSNLSEEFNNYLANSLNENLLLRYKDLLRFIVFTKGERLKEISHIIGFSEVTKMKEVLKKASNELKTQNKNKNYDSLISTKQALIIEQIGQNIIDDVQYFDAIKKLVAPLKLPVEVKDDQSIETILEFIKKPEDTGAIIAQASYEKVIEGLKQFRIFLQSILPSYENYYKKFQDIAKDTEKFKAISLGGLLSEGLSILERRVFEDEKCPLCLQVKNRDNLIDELRKRIEELSSFKKEKEGLEEDHRSTQKIIQNALSELDTELKEKCLSLEENNTIKGEISSVRASVFEALDRFKKYSVTTSKDILKPNEFLQIDDSKIQSWESTLSDKMKKIAAERATDPRFTITSKLSLVRQAHKEIKSLKEEADILSDQYRSIEIIYREFVKKQKEGLISFLTGISRDINDLYLFMNPSENIEEIELIPLGEDEEFVGITIQFKFHGEVVSPPDKYLSESHLNCLGICLFLASVKAFNKINKFFILDDVISSFDTNHRARFARLLVEKFSDYQILLFTHEKDWFEIVSNMVRGKNWIIKRMYWDHENGATIEPPPFTLKEEIENKLKKADTTSLGNSIRIYLERLLKEICHDLKVKVEFRFNGHNGNRMANELLSELKSKLKDRKCELKDQAAFDRLNSSMFLGNRTSHDSSFEESIDDLEMFYGDVQELEKIFRCLQCGNLVSKKHYDNVSDKVRCSCGALQYNWEK